MKDSLIIQNWMQLTDKERLAQFRQVLLYFVSPLLQVGQVKTIQCSFKGAILKTFQVNIQGDEFCFVPGCGNVTLGWDQGTHDVKRSTLMRPEWPQETMEDPVGLNAKLSDWVNEKTTPIRKVNLPAMLVSKYAKSTGTQIKGILNPVTRGFTGDQFWFNENKIRIFDALEKNSDQNDLGSYEFPEILTEDNFALKLTEDHQNYQVHELIEIDYSELLRRLDRYGFTLLSEDQWEYMVGAGQRDLFHWGNDIRVNLAANDNLASRPNCFGIHFDTSETRYELTNQPNIMKMGPAVDDEGVLLKQLMPLSTYYQSGAHLNIAKKNKILKGDLLSYRKAIIIAMD